MVNDLYLNGRKISGILTEGAVNTQGKPDFAVVGIGVNIKSVKKCFSQDLLDIASSLEDETGKTFSAAQTAAYIINEFDLLLPDFEKAEFLAQLEQIFTGVVFSEEDILTQLVIDKRDSASYVTGISAGGITISGEDFRKRLGLNSACFSIGEADGKIRIVTKGLGHGLGLSEWGANELAKQGKDYIEILKYYFPNIEITE